MTLENLAERLKYVGRNLSEAQKDKLQNLFRNSVRFSTPIESKIAYIEASLEEEGCFILHENGAIDNIFDENEPNTFGIMVWGDDTESTIIVAYY